MSRLKTLFARPTPYVAWLVASAIALACAQAADPYLFGFAAYGAAGISGVLLAIAPWFGTRAFLWAVAAALPTALSFALLSTYNWA